MSTAAVHAPAITHEMLTRIMPARLESWLARQRWFGAKGRRVRRVNWRDVISLGDPRFAIARLSITLDDVVWEYQVPLAIVAEGMPDESAVIDALEVDGTRWVLTDGSRDSAWRAAIGDVLMRGVTLPGEHSRCEVALGSVPPAIDAACSKTGSAEQSNTNIVFDDRAILKLYRRLERGEHPDAEIAVALSGAGFHDTPVVYATARIVDSEGASVTALMSEFCSGSRDAWSHILELGAEDFSRDASGEPVAARDAHRIGAITRAMHDALAGMSGDAFAPEPASAADVRSWASTAHEMAAQSLALLAQSPSMSSVAHGSEIVAARDALLSDLDQLAEQAAADPGMRLRHHGDYHLGQLLYTPNDRYLVIDFEGEPSRSIAERRTKTSPLRDVAGMLRSFAYAAATLARSRDAASALEERREQWNAAMRHAFLAGYGFDRAPAWLPRDHANARALLAIFEREKLFYELSYELNNRPDWAWIPLNGIAHLGAAEND